MDILGLLPPTSGQRRFLVLAVDYFIKCIEAEPLIKSHPYKFNNKGCD